MAIRAAHILKSSEDGRRHICADSENWKEIKAFLKEDQKRLNKFWDICGLILQGLRNSELYDKENIDAKTKDVTAMKMFKRGQNIRLYCKEQKGINGTFYIIVAELLPKKKDQKVKGKSKALIQKVGSYEYQITSNPQQPK